MPDPEDFSNLITNPVSGGYSEAEDAHGFLDQWRQVRRTLGSAVAVGEGSVTGDGLKGEAALPASPCEFFLQSSRYFGIRTFAETKWPICTALKNVRKLL